MWPNPQETAHLVTFTEEILSGKLLFLCSVSYYSYFGTCYFESWYFNKDFGIVICYSSSHLEVFQKKVFLEIS